jgi:pimeloyl-ACP methyl ester carboxylesterase
MSAIAPVSTTILASPAAVSAPPSPGPSPSPVPAAASPAVSPPPVAAPPAASPAPSPVAAASPGAIVRREGSYEGGTYRYVVPSNWNGGLVMYAHGIQQGRGLGPTVEEPPLAGILTLRGYAWAASSYRAREYVPNFGMEDTLALKRLFVREVGQPRWTILYGQSMGGQITTASLETYPDEYQAGLAECGVVDGIWEVDFLVAYTAVAQLISGMPLLGATDAASLRRLVEEQWLPIMGTPEAFTEKGRQFDSVVKYLTGGNEASDLPYRTEGLGARYVANLTPYAGVTATTVPSFPHVDTNHVVYQIDPGLGLTAEEVNRDVTRITRQPGSRDPSRDPAFADRTGRLRGPLLTLHTTGDGWVPFSHEQRYRRKTIAAGTSDLLVQRAIRRARHCELTATERAQALDDLVTWLEHGTRPDGDDVLATDLSQIGLRWTNPLNPDDPGRQP